MLTGNSCAQFSYSFFFLSGVLAENSSDLARASTPQPKESLSDETEAANADTTESTSAADVTDSFMPDEQLCSDDSDTAGYYQVSTNTSTSQSTNNESNNPSYQRGLLSSR